MKTNLLNIASDISETVYVQADEPNNSSINTLINEFGDTSFDCDIELQHDYTPYDYETGDQYSFDITQVDVTVLNVFDSEGDVIKVNKIVLRQIEKTLAENLTFEITKKY